MLLIFVTPAMANHIDIATVTATCSPSNYSLFVSASELTPGTNYNITYTIDVAPAATGFPITGSIPFTATSTSFSDTVTGSFPTLSGSYTFSGTTVFLTNSTISLTTDQPYTFQVPNAQITFSPSASCATTTFDSPTNTWITTVPLSGTDDIFLAGVAIPVPATKNSVLSAEQQAAADRISLGPGAVP